MYLSHYRLDKKPFNTTPDPDFLWLSATHTAALETLREGISIREGCVLLTGDIGTGKTILIRHLVRLNDVAAIFVTIHDPSLTRLDFCNHLAFECGLNRSFDRREEFYQRFKPFLSERFSAFRKVLVVIDEAQRLNAQVLQEAVALSDLELAGRRLLKVVFVGQLEFNQVLKQEENRDLPQRIKAHYCLEPLTEGETRLYVHHRLTVAGRQTRLFTDDALQAVYSLSRGYPRLINILCDHALLYGYSANLKEIDGRIVRECSRDLEMSMHIEPPPDTGAAASSRGGTSESSNQPPPSSAPRRWRPLFYLGAAVALLLLVFFVVTH